MYDGDGGTPVSGILIITLVIKNCLSPLSSHPSALSLSSLSTLKCLMYSSTN